MSQTTLRAGPPCELSLCAYEADADVVGNGFIFNYLHYAALG